MARTNLTENGNNIHCRVVEGGVGGRWRDAWGKNVALGFLECPRYFSRRVELIFDLHRVHRSRYTLGMFDPVHGPAGEIRL